MPTTIAFDVYGTLIDTNGVVDKLSESIGELAPAFANTWRKKQLEYSFRRGLMQNYQHFGICTQQALEYSCLFYQIEMTPTQKQDLLDVYKTLPVFDDVVTALEDLKQSGHELYAFSNGNQEAVEGLLKTANIQDYFLGVVSVDDLKTFKPNPSVYAHFLRQANAKANDAWLISSNPFDVIGALSHGMRAAWVKRNEQAIFDPWEMEPTMTINGLNELSHALQST